MSLAVVVGDVINDIVVRQHAPIATGSDTPSSIEPRPGGSGANLAAWMGALGGSVRFVGRAGRADAGTHRQALAAWGVDARISADDAQPTGTIVVQVGTDGERSMFTDRGASAGLDPVDLDPVVLSGASLLHLSGYCLFEPGSRAAAMDLWDVAGEAGLIRTVDPSSAAGLVAVGPATFLEWTAGASVSFPNLDEGRLLTGLSGPEDVVAALLPSYETVALKMGAGGVVVGSPTSGVVSRSAGGVAALDSTGAGDAFAAGYLTAMLTGAGVIEAADAGLAASAKAVTVVGGRPA